MNDTYDSRTILLHWISAALVVGLWAIGQTIDWFPRGTPRATARSLHIVFGLGLAIVLAARIVWRLRSGKQLDAADAGLLGRLASAGHLLLYALLIAAVLAGIANTWIRGDQIFGLFTLPAFDPGNKALRRNAGELHEWLANALLALAFLHAAAAVWHHRVRRDDVLRRMWPALPARRSSS